MKITKKQHLYYDVVISSLAFIAVILCIIDISDGLLLWQKVLDYIILTIFTADYMIRLHKATDKKRFVKNCIFDLIAILPFSTVFRAFRLAGIIQKLVKVPRILAFLYRPLKKLKKVFNSDSFKYVLFITILMILTGGILIHFAEGMSIPDGIWWAFVTATTVGYGDISPESFYGRLIAMVLMLVGIGLIGTVTSTITSYFIDNRQKKSMADETLDMIKGKLDDFENLTVEDVDVICKLLKELKK